MIVIGVTGSLASGKSTASAILKKKGAVVFDADAAARRALAKGSPAYSAVVKLFGRSYLKRGGQIDRPKLAWRVFSNPEDLKKLNILTHPGVIFDALKLIARCRSKPGILVLDVPLLFESHMENLADATIVVSAPRRVLVERAKRKGMPPKLAAKILASQWPIAKKEKLADHVIRTDGSLRDLERKLVSAVTAIKAKLS